MYGIMLIVVLVITGGVIAFIGDRVGTKVGKKKLSLFGMRPRHTSILVTIITGICITTLTFIILAAASENVRTALFGMEELNQQMAETRTKLETAGQRLGEAEKARTKADAELKVAQGEVSKLQEQQSNLEQRAKELAAGNADLEAAKESLLAENQGLVNGNEVLSRVNAKLVSDNNELEKRAEAFREDAIAVREGDIIFRAGEILASGIIKGNRPLKEVQTDMGTIIALANQMVLQRLGEKEGKEGVWIFRPEFEQASEYIAAGEMDVVVRLVAAGNLVRGEPIRSTFQLFQNSTVYTEGEVIYAQPYDWQGGNHGEAQGILMAFLREVNHAAQGKGILADPLSGSVGVMEGTQFYDAVAELAAMPTGRIVISAYAQSDTDAMGPLRLVLKVEREK